jgi:Spy/CpxP family protein refolding chaperone
MKLNKTLGLLIVAVATISGGAAVAAATATQTIPATTAATGGKHWHRHHGLLVGVTLRATRQLGLSAEQQQSIKSILSTARAQHEQAGAAGSLDLTALANPGDPNYATALQNAKTAAAIRIQSESALQEQIYNVLTSEQKAKLPQVLADMKTKLEQRRAAWREQHEAPAAGAAGSN